MKYFLIVLAMLVLTGGVNAPLLGAEEIPPAPVAEPAPQPARQDTSYLVGIDDILEIHVIRPEVIDLTVTVSPDGSVTLPYIGVVIAKDKTPTQLQDAQK